MGFQSNFQMYNITTENELSVILSHFNTEFVFDIIRDNLSKKFNYNIIQRYTQNGLFLSKR